MAPLNDVGTRKEDTRARATRVLDDVTTIRVEGDAP